jgi:hypothetical protein
VSNRRVAGGDTEILITEMTAHGTNSLETKLDLYWLDVHLPTTSAQDGHSVSHVVYERRMIMSVPQASLQWSLQLLALK